MTLIISREPGYMIERSRLRPLRIVRISLAVNPSSE
jgi:hypothetical protein